VVFFQDFGLLAYAPDGRPVWQLPLEPPANNLGSASSPILAGDLVIQVLAGDTASRVLAVDRKRGRKRWEAPLHGMTYATPAMVPLQGQAGTVVVLSTGELAAFDVRDGKRLWWVRPVPYQPKTSPVVSPDGKLVFIAVSSITDDTMRILRDFDKLLQMFDVDGDSRITPAEIRKRRDQSTRSRNST
jgi:outer membrane protein assembly factor BamB